MRAADHLVAAGMPRIALTRAYFAAFHAARAALYAEDRAPRGHSGVHHLFNARLVRTGQFEPDAWRLLARLQKYREEADHAQAFVVDEAGAREEIEAARGLVEAVIRKLGR